MTTFTTEDRELEEEPILFYGSCYSTDPTTHDINSLSPIMLKKFKVEYRIDESSEDLEG
jgi:hypothetical protein